VLAGVLASGLFVYLTLTLLWPEKFL
ncbi:MAG: K(+)-transporting ATPase subunit F, partial [Burkholderiales bacterium]|nr:K(+)-transporting ATPase subunit F [Phycisphaerae bacterium]